MKDESEVSVLYVSSHPNKYLLKSFEEEKLKEKGIKITIVAHTEEADILIKRPTKFIVVIVDTVPRGSEKAAEWQDRGADVIKLFDNRKDWYTRFPSFSKCSLSENAKYISAMILGLKK